MIIHPFEVYNSATFSIFIKLYNHDHYLIPECFYHPKEIPSALDNP